MPYIFISYRRSDSRKDAGRVYDRLIATFGKDNIFKDVDNIPFGQDFRRVLSEAVGSCDVLLAIIGHNWLSIADEQGNTRLNNPADFVRIEIETALQRGDTDCLVIPVLVDNATMPAADKLPLELRPLAFKNAITVRDDPDFHHDMERLVRQLQRYDEELSRRHSAKEAEMRRIVELEAQAKAEAEERERKRIDQELIRQKAEDEETVPLEATRDEPVRLSHVQFKAPEHERQAQPTAQAHETPAPNSYRLPPLDESENRVFEVQPLSSNQSVRLTSRQRMYIGIAILMIAVGMYLIVSQLSHPNNQGGGETVTGGAPVVRIAAPLPNATYLEGVSVNIQAAISNAGTDIDRVEVLVDNAIAATLLTPNTANAPAFSVAQTWTAAGAGQHSITVTAFRVDGSSSEPASVNVTVVTQAALIPSSSSLSFVHVF